MQVREHGDYLPDFKRTNRIVDLFNGVIKRIKPSNRQSADVFYRTNRIVQLSKYLLRRKFEYPRVSVYVF